MIKLTIAASVLLASTSAFAQTAAPAGPPAPTTTTTSSTTAQPAEPSATATQPSTTTTTTTTATDPLAPGSAQPASPATPAVPADPSEGTPATPATPATPSANAAKEEPATGDSVATTVEADWAKYDANSGGTLSRTEFNKWVTDLQTAADKKAPTRGYLTSAFRKADADKNGSISKEELQTFLRG